LCSNWLLKHITEEKIEERIQVMGRQGRRHKQLLDGKMELEIERVSIKLLSVEVLWKRLWTFCKTTV
jgi:hypothetical protein